MANPLFYRNNIKIQGNGEKPILFLHGYGCDQNMWRYITPAFNEDYKLILIDLVGSGMSDEKAYDYHKYESLQGYANDVIEICEALALTDVILMCHSVSSMIGSLAAIKKPSYFKYLIMIGPSPRYINDDDYFGGFPKEAIEELMETLDSNYLGWSNAMAPVIMGNPDRPELAEELENSFCQNNPKIAKHFARVTFLGDNRKDLKNITTKTLVIQSKNDVIAPLKIGEYVHGHIENSKLTVVDTVGHCPHLSSPKQVIKATEEYFLAAN